MDTKRLVPHAEVQQITNRGRSAIHKWVKAGKFPQPMRHASGLLIGWRSEDVEAWLNGTWEAEK